MTVAIYCGFVVAYAICLKAVVNLPKEDC